MMYLSTLLINVGSNPDRPRPGRLWLRNRYRVHQRLCMAFPTPTQRDRDPEFLLPYQPCGFYDPRPELCTISTKPEEPSSPCADSALDRPVNVPRDADHNFLFRIDPKAGGRVVILVQSALEPDWGYAFHNADYLLAAPVDVRRFNPHFEPNQLLRFSVLANPVRKVSRKSVDFNGELFDECWHGKDVPVPTANLGHWLERRAEPGWTPQKNSEGKQRPPGFSITKIDEIQAGYVYVNKSQTRDTGRRLRSVLYDGILKVTDPKNFRNTLVGGIGPAKAFGFGLLSVAPVKP